MHSHVLMAREGGCDTQTIATQKKSASEPKRTSRGPLLLYGSGSSPNLRPKSPLVDARHQTGRVRHVVCVFRKGLK